MNGIRADRVILCADIGTSSLKAAFVDYEGKLRGFVRETYPAERVVAGKTTSTDWENAFKRAISVLLSATSDNRIEIGAICVSGNGPTLVPVDVDGQALAPLHWHDGRIVKPADPGLRSFFLPRAAWLRDHEGAAYERTRLFLSCQEWLSARLGAEAVGVLSSSAYRPYFWDDAQIRAFGLEPEKFPPLVLMGERIGAVSKTAEATFGIPSGTPIVAAGTDYFMALVGVGVIENGMVCDRAGTSEGINVCADKPAKGTELLTLPQLRPQLWHVSASLPTTGRLFEWFRTITGQTGRNYQEMLEEIEAASSRTFARPVYGATEPQSCLDTANDRKPACGGFFFPDVRAAGNLSASSAFISTAGLTTRAELGRAVVEAIGYMVRGAIDKLEKHGYRVESMRLSGGQAKNAAWNRLKADITGRYLAIPEIEDGELTGNLCASLYALGESRSVEDAVSRTVRIARVYEPDQKAFAIHSERYDSYKTMLAKMERFFE
ncbi:MAG: FGGY-family carbohydrate kinase [Treponemataceae bacterium]